MSYRLFFPDRVKKEIDSLDKPIKNKIKIKIFELHSGVEQNNKIKKLSGGKITHYRLRVGDFRVLFDIEYSNNTITIQKVGHRKNIYKDLQ